VELRLAHEQGLIHQRNLNHFQHWALMYWIVMDRRTAIEDRRTELEQQCFNLFPERWMQIYNTTQLLSAPEDDEVPVDDIDELTRWYESIERQRSMGGAMADGSADPRDGQQWPADEQFGPWT